MANKINENKIKELEQLRAKALDQIRTIESKNINSKYTKEDQNTEKLPYILQIQQIDRELGNLK